MKTNSVETKSSELTLDEAIKWAQEWQQSSELAIPAEIVTGLVDGAIALKQALTRIVRKADAASVAGYQKASSYAQELRDIESIARAALVDGSTPKDEGERCPDCGSTEAGSCFYCKQD